MQYGSLTKASVMVVFVDIDMYRLVVENQSLFFFVCFFFDTHAACDKYGPDSHVRDSYQTRSHWHRNCSRAAQ